MNDGASMRQTKWDLRFLDLAKHISSWSKDPSTKVGAVICDGIKIISIGFNGLPQNISIIEEDILNNRTEKYKYIIHAEMNAILTAASNVRNCTLYTYPFLPCTNCASMMAQSGVKRIVAPKCVNPMWEERIQQSKNFLSHTNIDVIEYDMCIT